MGKYDEDQLIYIDMMDTQNQQHRSKANSDARDIISMILAVYWSVLPPLLLAFGGAWGIYFLLKFAVGR